MLFRAVGWVLLLAVPAAAQNDYSSSKRPCFPRRGDRPCTLCSLFDQIKKLPNDQAASRITSFLTFPKERERYHALKLLAETREEKIIRGLARTQLDASYGNAIAEVLGMIKDPVATDDLIAALKGKAAAKAAWALGRIGEKKAVDPLLKLFKKKKWETRAAALEALAQIAPDRVPELIPQALKDKNHPVRMMAAWVSPAADESGAPETFKTLLGDKDWRVRVAAIEACLALRSRECVGMLIDRFGRENGRLRLDILGALLDLTGKNLGLNPKPWKEWWTVNKDSFVPVARDPKARRGGVVDKDTGTATFFDIPILSTRIAFVLDLSGSMRGPYPDKDPKKPQTRLERAKAEMIATINGFAREQMFNILCLGSSEDGTYDTAGKVWKRRLIAATPGGKKDAAGFIRRQEARGWTNIYDALVLAMEDPNVDTIYLLSDGGASRGVFFDITDILDQIRRRNRFRKIHIHTVHFEAPEKGRDFPMRSHVWLMEDLAEITGGTYTQRFPEGK